MSWEGISFPPKDSDVSAADPNDILKNMKVRHKAVVNPGQGPARCVCVHGRILCPLSAPAQDMDDMDADLFGSKKKPNAQTKPFGNEGSKKGSPTAKSEVKPEGAGNLPEFLSLSWASHSRQLLKFP